MTDRKIIPSERQAEEHGAAITKGERDRDFTVFQYRQPVTGLTLFGIRIKEDGRIIRRA